MLQMNVWDNALKIKWNLQVVYGAAQEENKLVFLAELSHFFASNTEPMIVGDGFNIIRYSNENSTLNGVHRYTPLFNSIIQFYELRELIMNGRMFTWSNNQENPVFEKLDRVLVTKEWEDLFPQATVNRLPREVSDHNPLIVSTAKKESLPFIQFRFDLSWLKNPEFFALVEKIWNKPCRAKPLLIRYNRNLSCSNNFLKVGVSIFKES